MEQKPLVLQHTRARLAPHSVQRARERSLEAVQVRAAVQGLDAVHKTDQVIAVAIRAPLERNLHTHALHLRHDRANSDPGHFSHTYQQQCT